MAVDMVPTTYGSCLDGSTPEPVLVDILQALRRLESRLDARDARLDQIEDPIKSEYMYSMFNSCRASYSSSVQTIDENQPYSLEHPKLHAELGIWNEIRPAAATSVTRFNGCQVKRIHHSPPAAPPSSPPQPVASEYQNSVRELQREYELENPNSPQTKEEDGVLRPGGPKSDAAREIPRSLYMANGLPGHCGFDPDPSTDARSSVYSTPRLSCLLFELEADPVHPVSRRSPVPGYYPRPMSTLNVAETNYTIGSVAYSDVTAGLPPHTAEVASEPTRPAVEDVECRSFSSSRTRRRSLEKVVGMGASLKRPLWAVTRLGRRLQAGAKRTQQRGAERAQRGVIGFRQSAHLVFRSMRRTRPYVVT